MFYGKNFINGQFREYDLTFKAINPSTEEVYGVFPDSGHEVVTEAVDAARNAFHTWKKESRVRRADLFDKLAQLIKRSHELLSEAISTETGKSFNESRAEVTEALHMCQVAASAGRQPYGECIASELPTKDAYVIRKPRGVVAVISPWNFPCAIGSFWSAAPALVEGNTVVHKPSELTPWVNHILASLYQEAGFPPGVFNVIHGDGNTGRRLVRANVDVILFTGSAEVGQEIRSHCAEVHSKTCSVECGSKSAVIVFEDGNLDLAVDVCIASALKLSGQRCVSSGRILVQDKPQSSNLFGPSVFDMFKQKFLAKISEHIPDDPFVCKPAFYGPLISASQRDKVEYYNNMARLDDDVEVLLDSRRVHEKGFFLTPFVYECDWANKPFLKQEVFGPHIALIPFKTTEDAIRIYNDTEYGLSLGIVTDDFRKHRQIAQECTAGMLYVNGGSVAAESHLPFSSWKKSGFGSSAAATWKAVTHTMAITVNYEKGNIQWAQGLK